MSGIDGCILLGAASRAQPGKSSWRGLLDLFSTFSHWVCGDLQCHWLLPSELGVQLTDACGMNWLPSGWNWSKKACLLPSQQAAGG